MLPSLPLLLIECGKGEKSFADLMTMYHSPLDVLYSTTSSAGTGASPVSFPSRFGIEQDGFSHLFFLSCSRNVVELLDKTHFWLSEYVSYLTLCHRCVDQSKSESHFILGHQTSQELKAGER